LLHVAHTGELRNRLLERMGLTADRRGMESWLKTGADAPAQAEWRAFLEIAQKAQRLNRDNGVLIDASMRANQHALQSLMSAGAATSTYGPGGRSMSPIASRALASA
jgi:flagellar biosynthesis/type III secretory pathway chaperone